MATTADLRIAARAAASTCDWYEAERLMREAIEAYPSPEGALAQRDLARMTQLADSWNASQANMLSAFQAGLAAVK